VQATAFKAIAAQKQDDDREENETSRGLRVADKGFMNTAVIQSEITYIDGNAGGKYDRIYVIVLLTVLF
jgi:citrate synthase